MSLFFLANHTLPRHSPLTKRRVKSSKTNCHLCFCKINSLTHSNQSIFLSLSTHQNQSKATMAATRIISSSSTNILTSSSSASFFNTTHFPKSHSLRLSFTNRSGSLSNKRLFTCRALYKPHEVNTKEAGQPETLDYRVFFLDNAGKKVSLFPIFLIHTSFACYSFFIDSFV